ncbi:SHOCT domain-containing protein [Nocardia nova]|uniref:SHOCT domain-containing protein n=1 Tax=Nocardia nova TaxID=37330 RepID=UPI00318301AA
MPDADADVTLRAPPCTALGTVRDQPANKAKETTMMMWYGNGLSGWGYALMIIGMVIFWALIGAGIVALIRYSGNSSSTIPNTIPEQRGPSPQQILAERYARGEIDEEEYIRRTKTLGTGTAA